MLPDVLVFSVEEDRYCWRDVVLSAVRQGEWRAVERRVREGAACVSAADQQGTALPAAALDAAARDFRYAEDLVTAQCMEEWLQRHDLSVQEWTAYIRRDVLRTRHTSDRRELVGRYPISDDEATRLTMVDAKCSSRLGTWARALAERAAAHASVVARRNGTHDPAAQRAVEPLPAQHVAPLAVLWGETRASLLPAAQRLERLDESQITFRAAVLTDRAVRDYVSARQLDWVRFDCRVMAFPNETMAAEAAMLLREDGEGFTSVYQVAHTEPRVGQFFLDQIDASMRDHFLGARVGDLIGPSRIEGEFVLYQVEKKALPTVDDPDVRRRAEDGVLRATIEHQVASRVTWQSPP